MSNIGIKSTYLGKPNKTIFELSNCTYDCGMCYKPFHNICHQHL